jgi:hypothetical protein
MAGGHRSNTRHKAITAAAAAGIAAAGIGCAATAHAFSGTVNLRSPWGYRCLLTDYRELSARYAVAQNPKPAGRTVCSDE